MSKLSLIQQLKQQKLSVGILSANWLQLNEEVTTLLENQINVLHFDIADGQFSSLFTVGAIGIKYFPTHCFKDVHLMVRNQLEVAKAVVANGANLVTLQLEQYHDFALTIEWLAKQKTTYTNQVYPVLIGACLCPETPISELEPYLDQIDVIQLLTLDPRSGTKYPSELILDRVIQVEKRLGNRRVEKLINIDGSMTLELAKYFKQGTHHIDWLVSGSALFSGELKTNLKVWKSSIM